MERYYELPQETTDLFNDLVKRLAFAFKIEFKLVGDAKLKKLIQITKTQPIMEFLYKHQMYVYINQDLLDLLDVDTEAVEILFMEELNNVMPNAESGKIKMGKPNLNTSTSIIDKYGLDEVKRAKDMERMTMEQAKEKAAEQEPPADIF
jgi:hypothetical protein